MNLYLGKEASWRRDSNEKITAKLSAIGLEFSNGFTIEDEHDQD